MQKFLVRSCVESTIASGGGNEIGFLDKLIEDHYKNRQKIANSILNSPEYKAELLSDQISKLLQLLIDIKNLFPNIELRSVNLEETAYKNGLLIL